MRYFWKKCSNNTNKLSPQELSEVVVAEAGGSNNTNKLSPQEHSNRPRFKFDRSNNTNKLSPQEQMCEFYN